MERGKDPFDDLISCSMSSSTVGQLQVLSPEQQPRQAQQAMGGPSMRQQQTHRQAQQVHSPGSPWATGNGLNGQSPGAPGRGSGMNGLNAFGSGVPLPSQPSLSPATSLAGTPNRSAGQPTRSPPPPPPGVSVSPGIPARPPPPPPSQLSKSGGSLPSSSGGMGVAPMRPPPPPPAGTSFPTDFMSMPSTNSFSGGVAPQGQGANMAISSLSSSLSLSPPPTARSAPGSYATFPFGTDPYNFQQRPIVSGPPSNNPDLASSLEALYVSTSRGSASSSKTGFFTPSPLDTPTGLPSPDFTSSPMAPRSTLMDPTAPEVDGISAAAVDSWFQAADTDGDGELIGAEAVAFFEMTGLSKEQLQLIWAFATDNKPGGLDRAKFSIALRLVALAQSGTHLKPETAAMAINPSPNGCRLPPPYLRWDKNDNGRTAAPSGHPVGPSPLSVPGRSVEVVIPDFPGPEVASSVVDSSSTTPTGTTVAELSRNLLSLEVRLVPLTPKSAGQLSTLAAGAGGLFAGVRGGGSCRLFQWGRAEGNVRNPEGAPNEVPPGEDSDMAAACDVQDQTLEEITCIHVDEISQVIWSGHKDGSVACWRLGPSGSRRIERMHSWKGHRSSGIIAIATTFRGDVWTGSRKGTIRMWSRARPGELPDGRICRELRREQGARAHLDQLLDMALCSTGEVLWSIGLVKVHIWEASSGKFLATLGNITYIGNITESLDTREGLPLEQDGRIKTGGVQRSLNYEEDIVMMDKGLGSVRNVAEAVTLGGVRSLAKGTEHAKKGADILLKFGKSIVKGGRATTPERTYSGGVEASVGSEAQQWSNRFSVARDTYGSTVGRTICCLLASKTAGSFWLGYHSGLLERYTPGGRLLWSEDLRAGVRALATAGSDVWAGLTDGSIFVYDETGRRRASWSAHRGPVVAIVSTGTRVYSMGVNGTITGWSAAVPDGGPIAWSSGWHARLRRLVQRRTIRVLAGTWNVNEKQPSQASLNTWLGNRARSAHVVIVGLQEIEMGSTSVAQAAFMDKLSLNEKGNTNAAWWRRSINQALASLEADAQVWCLVALRQLSGMLVLVFVRRELFPYIGEISTDSVGCGVLGVGGNKGAVAVGFSIYRSYIVCANSHFAAHQKDVEKRNENYTQICNSLRLRSGKKVDAEAAAAAAGVKEREKEVGEEDESALDPSDLRSSEERTILDSDAVVWVGDFNYRVDMDRDEVVNKVKGDELQAVLEADQCRREMLAGRTFVGLQEAAIAFPPTYKFDKNTTNPYAYDSSEKRRIPSWTDRIFFRGSTRRGSHNPMAVHIASEEYNACMGVSDSDHKPVFSFLSLDIPVLDMTRKRRESSHMLKQCLTDQGVSLDAATGVALGPESVTLYGGAVEVVVLSNYSSEPVEFSVMGSSGALAIPLTISVWPVRSIIPPNSSANLMVALTDFEDQSYIHESFHTVLTVLFERLYAEGSDGRIGRAVGRQINVTYSTR